MFSVRVIVAFGGFAGGSRHIAAVDPCNWGELCLSAVDAGNGVHIIKCSTCAGIAGARAFRTGDSEFRAGFESVFASGPTDRVRVAPTRALVNLRYSGGEIRSTDNMRKLE